MKRSRWPRNQELECALVMSLVLLIASWSMAQGIAPASTPILPLAATDSLGRTLPTPGKILDFDVSGDVALEGRYRFRYVTD